MDARRSFICASTLETFVALCSAALGEVGHCLREPIDAFEAEVALFAHAVGVAGVSPGALAGPVISEAAGEGRVGLGFGLSRRIGG